MSGLLKYLSARKDEVILSSSATITLRGLARATVAGDAVPYEQALKIDKDGVTIPGNYTFSGTITLSTPLADSVTTDITAFAGGGQASAVALTSDFNNITVCATAGDSVKLPAAAAGLSITVKNSGATGLDIFPASADSIDALAVNLAVRIQPGVVISFFAKDAIVWESDKDQSISLIAPTTNKGQLEFKATDSTGNTVTTITNAIQAAARTYTIPDAGASASFAMTEGAQTLNGVQTYGAINIEKATTGLTALAGGAQAGTALSSQYNNFTTVVTALDSAQLPVAVLGKKITIKNNATSKFAMTIFGQTGDSIGNGAANAPIILAYQEEIVLTAINGTTWRSNISAVDVVTGVITEERTATATEIVGTSAEDLGHASGFTLVAAPGAGYALEFISALVIYDFGVAAYTGGGDDTSIRLGGGGAAITGIVTSANLIGAAGDKIVRFSPLSTAALPVTANVAISLVSTTAWTQPGTAAGVLRVQTSYRIHRTGL